MSHLWESKPYFQLETWQYLYRHPEQTQSTGQWLTSHPGYNVCRQRVVHMHCSKSIWNAKFDNGAISSRLLFYPVLNVALIFLICVKCCFTVVAPQSDYPMTEMFAVRGKPFQLQCPLSAFPDPVINWTKHSGPSNRLGKILEVPSMTVLTFKSTEDSDSGLYECSARNHLGSGTAKVKLLVNGEEELSSQSHSLLQDDCFTLCYCCCSSSFHFSLAQEHYIY